MQDVRLELTLSNNMKLECKDVDSRLRVFTIEMTPEKLMKLLRGFGMEFDAKLNMNSNIGKQKKYKIHEFEIPNDLSFEDEPNVESKLAIATCPTGWQPELYFSSSDSFIQRDGKSFAKCKIVQWVPKK